MCIFGRIVYHSTNQIWFKSSPIAFKMSPMDGLSQKTRDIFSDHDGRTTVSHQTSADSTRADRAVPRGFFHQRNVAGFQSIQR